MADRTAITTSINTKLADNTTKDITPADVREVLEEINQNTYNKDVELLAPLVDGKIPVEFLPEASETIPFSGITGDPMNNTALAAKFDSITESFEEVYGGRGILEYASLYVDAVDWTSMTLGPEIAQLQYSINDGAYNTPVFPVSIPANARVNYKIVYVNSIYNLSSFILRFTKI